MAQVTRYDVKRLMDDFQTSPFSNHYSKFEITCYEPGGDGKWVKHLPPDVPAGSLERWAKNIVRALCMDFREPGDKDGRSGLAAGLYPHLTYLWVEHGVIKVQITRAYNG